MSTNLYTVTVPPMMAMLKSLDALLDKAAAHAATRKTERLDFEKALLGMSLVFDQFPFSRQIQIACDNAKNGAARLAGIEAPKYEDTESTIAELKARIAKTLEFMGTIKPEQVIGREDAEARLPYSPDKHMRMFEYATLQLMPNFYFHAATAYAILRANGLAIGKGDFLTNLPWIQG